MPTAVLSPPNGLSSPPSPPSPAVAAVPRRLDTEFNGEEVRLRRAGVAAVLENLARQVDDELSPRDPTAPSCSTASGVSMDRPPPRSIVQDICGVDPQFQERGTNFGDGKSINANLPAKKERERVKFPSFS